jgi:hypothetical protein
MAFPKASTKESRQIPLSTNILLGTETAWTAPTSFGGPVNRSGRGHCGIIFSGEGRAGCHRLTRQPAGIN